MFEKVMHLKDLEKSKNYINVCIVGIGKMGKSLVDRLIGLDGYRPRLIVNRNLDNIYKALEDLNFPKEKIYHVKSIDDLDAMADDMIGITSDLAIGVESKTIDCLVEATGDSHYGAKVAYSAILNKKHIVMLNVEADATVGPILYEKAKDAGVVYTGSAGDEPGAIIEIFEFSKLSGLEIVACGKGKNNPKNIHASLGDIRDDASKRGLSPSALLSFVDATNTMVELNIVSNATGFTPDVYGLHGIDSNIDDLADKLRLKEDGGELSSWQVVDYVNGISPGVFVGVRARTKESQDMLRYTGMGPGPIHIIYRPYHLCSLETPSTIYNAVIENKADLVPACGQVSDVVAHAKRNIKKGQSLTGIGSNEVYGSLTTYQDAKARNLLPIGLINDRTLAKVDIKKDTAISYDMVDLDTSSLIVKLRQEQDQSHV